MTLSTIQQTLKATLREKRDHMSQAHATRLHRALSWLACAAKQEDDADLQFISLWVSFNACYAVDEGGSESLAERFAFQRFVEKITQLDTHKYIYACLWQTYSGPVKALIKNPYVYHGYWAAKRLDVQNDEWAKGFDQSSVAALNCLSRQNVPELLAIVLDRLFVLRNQILHGGATYQSQLNREQVNDGVQLLIALLPIVIEIMLSTPDEDWGDIYYPVVS
jgi:hypothetical protein